MFCAYSLYETGFFSYLRINKHCNTTQALVLQPSEPPCGDQSPCLRRGLGVGQNCKCVRRPQGVLSGAKGIPRYCKVDENLNK